MKILVVSREILQRRTIFHVALENIQLKRYLQHPIEGDWYIRKTHVFLNDFDTCVCSSFVCDETPELTYADLHQLRHFLRKQLLPQ